MAPLALILSLLLLPSLVFADTIHVPLTRRTRSTRAFDLNEEALRLRQRYGRTNATSLASRYSGTGRRAAVADIPVTNLDTDKFFFGQVTIGTPSQTFNVVLDTGSSNFWLAGTTCTTCPQAMSLFDFKSSSSFKTINTTPLTLAYGSGSIHGVMSSDTVTMGGFTIANQGMLTVDSISANLFNNENVTGIMGLAFAALAGDKALPFWQGLVNNNQLDSPEFAFWINRAPAMNNQKDIPGGVFTLGGTNASLFSGDIDFVNMPNMPAESRKFWSLPLSSITVGGKSISITGATAVTAIDTGTSLLGGPTADVNAIWAAVPNSDPSPAGKGFFNFPCSQQVNVEISFGGKSWAISAQDMIVLQEPSDSTKCIGAIFDIDAVSTLTQNPGTPAWFVGDTFLKNVYSVFRADPPSIGFAQLSTKAGGTGQYIIDNFSTVTSVLTNSPSATASILFPGTPSSTTGSSPTGPSTGPTTGKSSGALSKTTSPLILVGLALMGAFILSL